MNVDASHPNVRTITDITSEEIATLCGVSPVYGDVAIALSRSNNAPLAMSLLAHEMGRNLIALPVPGSWAMYIDCNEDRDTLCLVQSPCYAAMRGDGKGPVEKMTIDTPRSLKANNVSVWRSE